MNIENTTPKKLAGPVIVFIFLLLSTAVFSDAPEGFNYQAVARDASGQVLSNEQVAIEINLLRGDLKGKAVFTEIHHKVTNEHGLVNLIIGQENPETFAEINWHNGPYFIRVFMNGIEMGTSQLMSVPYAMYAAQSGDGPPGVGIEDVRFNEDATVTIYLTDGSSYTSPEISFPDDPTSLLPEPENPGEMMYFNGSEWQVIPQGEQNQTLTFCDGFPNWGPCDEIPYLVNISPVNDIEVPYGTSEQSAKESLDENTTIEDSDGVIHTVNLHWSFNHYNEQQAGSYQATGSFSLPYGVGQPDPEVPLKVEATVEVLEEDNGTLTISDYDGNVYQIVEIGQQTWMAENLRSLHYHDGTPIEGVYSYDDEESLINEYGRIYTWDAATNGEVDGGKANPVIQGICPPGWRLPSNDDWTELKDHIEAQSLTGGSLKSTRGFPEDEHPRWVPPNTGATNTTGFNGIPGGFRRMNGEFRFRESSGFFWSASESTGLPDPGSPVQASKAEKLQTPQNPASESSREIETDMAYLKMLNTNSEDLQLLNLEKPTGLSVRCVKD